MMHNSEAFIYCGLHKEREESIYSSPLWGHNRFAQGWKLDVMNETLDAWIDKTYGSC